MDSEAGGGLYALAAVSKMVRVDHLLVGGVGINASSTSRSSAFAKMLDSMMPSAASTASQVAQDHGITSNYASGGYITKAL